MPPGKGLWYTAARNYKRVFFFQLVWFFFLFNSFELYICKIFYVSALLKKKIGDTLHCIVCIIKIPCALFIYIYVFRAIFLYPNI